MNARVAKRLRREAASMAFAGSRLMPDFVYKTTFRYPAGSRRAIYKKLKREHTRKGRETR